MESKSMKSDMMINLNNVTKIYVIPTKVNTLWKHHIYDTKFLFWKKHYDYWTYFWSFDDEVYSEEELIEVLKPSDFFKDGEVYTKPHINFILANKDSETIYFETDDELKDYTHRIISKYGESLVIIE